MATRLLLSSLNVGPLLSSKLRSPLEYQNEEVSTGLLRERFA